MPRAPKPKLQGPDVGQAPIQRLMTAHGSVWLMSYRWQRGAWVATAARFSSIGQREQLGELTSAGDFETVEQQLVRLVEERGAASDSPRRRRLRGGQPR